MGQRIQGMLFDLGETLLNFGSADVHGLFEQGTRQAYEALRGRGLKLPSFVSYHRRHFWAIRWNYFKSRLTRREFDVLPLMAAIHRRMGLKLDDAMLLELAWLWYEPMSRRGMPEPGVHEMLANFQSAGLKLGLVSNTFIPGKVLDRHLERAGLLEYLPVRIYSCNVRYRKPHPAIFQAALDASGLTPRQTIFVGDTLKPDIFGANRMGMISVLHDPAGRHGKTPIKPAFRIASILELQKVLAELNAGSI
ncbi:MAG: HAD family hydrolase [Planctomycetes bacterium]|nr:HAD family hydrolase [Planctomycetota bacterium]